MFFSKLKRSLRCGGLQDSEYAALKEAIIEKNQNTLSIAGWVGFALLAMLYVVSFLVATVAANRTLYLMTMVAMGAINTAFMTICRKNSKYVMPCSYLILVVAYAFGIVLGDVIQRSGSAVTFCVLIFALPLLMIDRPYKIGILLIAVTVVHILASAAIKTPDLVVTDVFNSLSFLVLGIFVNLHVTTTQIYDLHNRRRIERERDTDELTHLMSKAAAEREIMYYMENRLEKAALIFVDVDNFKMVNDSMGHAFGDTVLRILGDCISAVFRKTDVLARFGGDEFILFLPYTDRRDIIEGRLDMLSDSLEARIAETAANAPITLSIGVAFFPENGRNYEELLKSADRTLYKVKNDGKGKYMFTK